MNSEAFDRVKNLLEIHEGAHLNSYRCPKGFWTIGIGCRLPLTKQERVKFGYPANPELIDNKTMYGLLEGRLKTFWADLRRRKPAGVNVDEMPETAQVVIADMMFNLGVSGLCKFKLTWGFISAGDWVEASKEMLRSEWAKDVRGRANRLSDMLATCAR